MRKYFRNVRTLLPIALLLLMGCGIGDPSQVNSWSVCDAASVCPAGSQEVPTEEDCPPGDSYCFQVTECGVTAWCSEPNTCDAMPVCPPGHVEVTECSDETCEEVTACGASIFCEATLDCPTVMPECPPSANQIETQEECPQGDVHCYEISECGGSVWCWEEVPPCEGTPVCPNHLEEVSECDGDGCERVTVCGDTIYCAEVACLDVMPECPVSSKTVDGPEDCFDDGDCFSLSNCSGTTWCTDQDVDCNDQPTCPIGAALIETCASTNLLCYEVTRCGTTISCLSL